MIFRPECGRVPLATVPDNFFVILADVFDSQNCNRSPSVYLKTPNSKSLLILLSSAGRAKSLQPAVLAAGQWPPPQIRGKPRQCAPPRNATAPAVDLGYRRLRDCARSAACHAYIVGSQAHSYRSGM